MDFQILGSFEVLDDGAAVRIPAGRERALLALLLVNRGRVVSVDADRCTPCGAARPPTPPPRRSRATSRTCAGCVPRDRTRAPGYVLEVPARLWTPPASPASPPRAATGSTRATPPRPRTPWRRPSPSGAAPPWPTSPTTSSPRTRSAASRRRGWRHRGPRRGSAAGRPHRRLAGELDAFVAAHPLRERLRVAGDARLVPGGAPGRRPRALRAGPAQPGAELGSIPGPSSPGPPADPESGPGARRPAPATRRRPPVCRRPSAPPRVRRRRALSWPRAIALVVAAVAVLALTRDSGGVTIHVPAVWRSTRPRTRWSPPWPPAPGRSRRRRRQRRLGGRRTRRHDHADRSGDPTGHADGRHRRSPPSISPSVPGRSGPRPVASARSSGSTPSSSRSPTASRWPAGRDRGADGPGDRRERRDGLGGRPGRPRAHRRGDWGAAAPIGLAAASALANQRGRRRRLGDDPPSARQARRGGLGPGDGRFLRRHLHPPGGRRRRRRVGRRRRTRGVSGGSTPPPARPSSRRRRGGQRRHRRRLRRRVGHLLVGRDGLRVDRQTGRPTR